MEPPSTELSEALRKLHLATDRDLRACRPLVRRLTQGLPAFDSVWIDALVRQGCLTRFQARRIEEKQWQELTVTDDIIITEQRHFDPVVPLFSAVKGSNREPVLVSRLPLNIKEIDATTQRLQNLVQLAEANRTAAILPLEFKVCKARQAVFVVGHHVAGESLDRLLVRRGRFPEEVVRAIASGVCDVISTVAGQQSHADLRLANIWLSKSGEVQTLNYGVLNAVQPKITIHTLLPTDAYNNLAPERFDGHSASPAADMYSLGCLLWHLLAGRPVFPVADPLAKIAAHQRGNMPDIREFAPDVSNELAGLIKQMTHCQPAKRMQSFAAVQDVLKRKQLNYRKRIVEFLERFESAAPRNSHPTQRKSSHKLVNTTAAILLTCLGSLIFWNRDNLGLPTLTKTEAATAAPAEGDFQKFAPLAAQDEGTDEARAITDDPNNVQPLPQPNEDGLILLGSGITYSLESINHDDSLVIQGPPEERPRLIVNHDDVKLQSPMLRFENLSITIESDSAPPNHSPISIAADELQFRNCLIHNSNGPPAKPLIAWESKQSDSSASGRLLMENCIVDSASPLLNVDSPLTTALCENLLLQQNGCLMLLQGGAKTGFKVPVVFNQCTLLGDHPVIQISSSDADSPPGLLSIRGQNSVAGAGETTPVIGFLTAPVPDQWWQHFQFVTEGFVTNRDAMLAGVRNPDSESWQPLDTSQLQVDGLLGATITASEFLPANEPELQLQQVHVKDLPVRIFALDPGFSWERFSAADKTL